MGGDLLLHTSGIPKRGIGRALARAAADHARDRGARAIEGYPIITQNVILEELHVGTAGMFADAGFIEVSRPTPRRIVMRIDFEAVVRHRALVARARGSPWQRLYLRPEPQGHGSLRDTPAQVSPSADASLRRCTPAAPSTVGAEYCRFVGRDGAAEPLGQDGADFLPVGLWPGPPPAGSAPTLSPSRLARQQHWLGQLLAVAGPRR